MKKTLVILCALFVLSTQALAAGKSVRLAYVEWDCATASSYLVKAVLEDKLGYQTEILPVSAAAMWMAVSTGDVDGLATAWLPVTHADYFEKVKDKVEDLGPLVGGARLGWAVPDYVPLTSMEELAANADKFKGKVIGIDPGAGLMKLSEKAMTDYNLDKMTLVEGSGATMVAALDDAIRRQEWVVVTAWSPHWMFGRWQLHYLDDPKNSLGEEEFIHTVVRSGLQQDMPEVHAFLDRFHYENANQLETLMAWNQEKNADLMANARRFMEEHPDLVKTWLGQ